jgi:hypothetical protein
VKRRRHLIGAGLALLSAACGRSPEVPGTDLPPVSTSAAPSSLLRLPRGGGFARAYLPPDLDTTDWRSEGKLPALAAAVGADGEQRVAYAVDRKGDVVTLDLDSRLVRTPIKNVRVASIGPDGSLYTVDTANVVTRLMRRTPARFRDPVRFTPKFLFGTMSGNVLAVGSGSGGLAILGPDQPAATVRLPRGDAAATFWGDLVAIAADSAVVLYEPAGKKDPRSIELSGHVRSVRFSPSGHRLYVGRDAKELLVIDRYSGSVLKRIELPGGARELRGDLNGNWLLVRPAAKDSAWVVDLTAGRYVGAVATPWGADLPAIVGAHTFVLRRGDDVVGLDLSAKGFAETGRVADGAADLWVSVNWTPAGPQAPAVAQAATPEEPGAEAAEDSAESLGPGAHLYLQVSSSRNPSWARELAGKLEAAGLPASVLPPNAGDEAHRVVVGPYRSREEAEEAGRKLGMPSFIIAAAAPASTPAAAPER